MVEYQTRNGSPMVLNANEHPNALSSRDKTSLSSSSSTRIIFRALWRRKTFLIGPVWKKAYITCKNFELFGGVKLSSYHRAYARVKFSSFLMREAWISLLSQGFGPFVSFSSFLEGETLSSDLAIFWAFRRLEAWFSSKFARKKGVREFRAF